MDSPIIYIIAAVLALIIVAGVVWFFINNSKKQQEQPARPVANPVPRHLMDEESDADPVSAAPQNNHLRNAQSFIEQQRYDAAESELKEGLKQNPSDNNLKLKLLNVYALTSNRESFNRLYNDFQAGADTMALQQANNLKSMLDEEDSMMVSAQTPQPVENSQPLTASQPVEDSTPNQPQEETPLEFDFDDFSDAGFDDDLGSTSSETGSETQSSPAMTMGSDESDDVLSFDDLESQLLDTSSSPSTEAQTTDLDTSLDNDTFDLNEDDTFNLAGEETFDFDNELQFESDEPTEQSQPSPSTPVINEAQSLDAFELDSPTLDDSNSSSTDLDSGVESSDLDSSSDSDGAFDFSLEFEESEETKTKVLDADMANTAPINMETAPVTPVDENELSFDDDSNDFDLSFDNEVVESSSPEQATAPTKELSVDSDIDDNALSFDDEDSLSFDDFDFQEETTVDSTPDTSAPTQTETSKMTLDWDSELPDTDSEIKPDLDNNLTIVPDTDALSADALDSSLEVVEDADGYDELDDTFAQLDALSDDERLGSTAAISATTDDKEGSDVSPVTKDSDDFDTFDLSDDAFDIEPTQSDTDTVSDSSTTEPQATATEAVQKVVAKPTEPVESAPVVDNEELMQTFGFVQELDNAQITLDLAHQYLELGEYESARRLVEEVMQNDLTSDQESSAKEILSRMD